VISEKKSRVIKLFSEGRKSYKLMDFLAAKDFFSRALKLDPEDGPSRVYFERCEFFISNPPPEDWDGVFVMTTK